MINAIRLRHFLAGSNWLYAEERCNLRKVIHTSQTDEYFLDVRQGVAADDDGLIRLTEICTECDATCLSPDTDN